MGQHAPGIVLEALPLLHKVIAHVIAHRVNDRAVGVADLVNVGGIDDHLTAVGDDRLHFVHALGRRPQVIVHLRHDRKHAPERPVLVDDVQPGREIGRRRPGCFHRTGVQTGQPLALDHQSQAGAGHGDKGRRPIDGLPHGRIFGADDGPTGDQRAQPVGEIDHLRPADAGKEILVTAGKTRHLVGKDRPADDEMIVIQDGFVDPHRHIQREHTVAEGASFVSGEVPQGDKRTRQIPAVIHDPRLSGSPVLHRRADQLAQRGIIHGLVGA